MPTQKDFNTKTTADYKSDFISLKTKGEKIRFRLIAPPYYDGKHFVKENGKTIVKDCPKIMNEENCELCNKYFSLMKEAKEYRKKGDLNKQKELTNQAKDYKVKVTFYYPIIDRDSKKGMVLKTSLSVRIKIDQEVANGIQVLNYDYILTRTENPGVDYYALIRQDSTMSPPLDDKEKTEVEKAKKLLEKLIRGKESDQDLGALEVNQDNIIVNEEKINPEDIPF